MVLLGFRFVSFSGCGIYLHPGPLFFVWMLISPLLWVDSIPWRIGDSKVQTAPSGSQRSSHEVEVIMVYSWLSLLLFNWEVWRWHHHYWAFIWSRWVANVEWIANVNHIQKDKSNIIWFCFACLLVLPLFQIIGHFRFSRYIVFTMYLDSVYLGAWHNLRT